MRKRGGAESGDEGLLLMKLRGEGGDVVMILCGGQRQHEGELRCKNGIVSA